MVCSCSLKIARQKDSIMILQTKLDSALQKEKSLCQNMVSKEVYEEAMRKSCICQDDLTQALEKVRPRWFSTKGEVEL